MDYVPFGEARVASKHSPRFRLAAAILMAATLPNVPAPSPASAQDFSPGRFPRDVTLEVLPRPYTVRGSTAEELLVEMLASGPTGLVSFPFWLEWRYQSEELRTAFTGNPAGVCRLSELELDFDITAAYPVWERPPDAPAELVAAWDDFLAMVTRRWEERRDGVLEYGREISRQLRRIEAPCPTMQARTSEVVERLLDANSEAARAAAAAGEGVRIQWPPPGYREAVAQTRRTPVPPPSPAPSPPRGAAPSDPAAVPVPEGLYEALEADLRQVGMLRVVTGVRHLGETRFLRAFGSDDSLSVRTHVELPAFTDVLVATLVGVLDRQGVLDMRASLSTYLAGLSPRLGSVTLEQILSHRSGLDNARVRPEMAWAEALDRLDDRALFTEPGSIYSYSIYGYPLAVRAVEQRTGSALSELVRVHVLEPAGMESTSLAPTPDGPPVAVTSGLDLMAFASTWLEGGFAGPSAFPGAGAAAPAPGERVYAAGLWRDWVGAHARTSLLCDARGGYTFGIELFPETRSAVVLLARRWPANTARFVLSAVAQELEIGQEIFEPLDPIGDGRLDLPPTSCTEPAWNRRRVSDAGEPAAAADWPGSYLNGDRRFLLQDVDGRLAAVPFEQPLAVTRYSGDLHFATMEGRPLFPIRLVRDRAGRRYVVLDDWAFLHEADRPPR